MKQLWIVVVTLVLSFPLASVSMGQQAAEPLLRKLPLGVILRSSTAVPAPKLAAIGAKLGGKIERLSNSVVAVQGRTIQVNVIAANDETNAQAIHDSLLKIKPSPFCLRKGAVVIEYVSKDADAALATKTSYELGFLDKPKSVRYRVTAELATVEKADYMACNPLFNQFLALRGGENAEAIRQIGELSKKFTFNRSLTLRSPKLGGEIADYQFQPSATEQAAAAATARYTFDTLPQRHGIPYTTATLEITVDDSGLVKQTDMPTGSLIAATPFWPADSAAIKDLAKKITQGHSDNDAKANAILKWLSPGQNIKYSGQTGARWGTEKVFQQKFGHCWDFSDCFVTLCRASGVPSRQVAGWLYGTSGHVWAEYYREGQGWQQVDPTGGGKLPCGIYHIPYFTSEDGEMPILYVAMPKIEILPMK